MEKALIIFIAGISGVFIGMALLYSSIRLSAAVTDRFTDWHKKSGTAKEVQ